MLWGGCLVGVVIQGRVWWGVGRYDVLVCAGGWLPGTGVERGLGVVEGNCCFCVIECFLEGRGQFESVDSSSLNMWTRDEGSAIYSETLACFFGGGVLSLFVLVRGEALHVDVHVR